MQDILEGGEVETNKNFKPGVQAQAVEAARGEAQKENEEAVAKTMMRRVREAVKEDLRSP